MTHRHHGCGPRGSVEFNLPEALFAMRGGRGWKGSWGPFHFDFDEENGWGRRGRRSRRMFESGELRLVLLKLIVDEPRHGYDLIRAIEELTGGEYAPSPGVIYPTLTLLQDMGLIEEAKELLGEKPEPDVLDAGLISKAQHVEHYEIAGYGTVRTYAQLLGEKEHVKLLQQTLDEEGNTDKKLTQLAESQINVEAMAEA